MPRASSAALAAISGASCNDMDYNLEQAELFGDALLKFASSVHIYLAK